MHQNLLQPWNSLPFSIVSFSILPLYFISHVPIPISPQSTHKVSSTSPPQESKRMALAKTSGNCRYIVWPVHLLWPGKTSSWMNRKPIRSHKLYRTIHFAYGTCWVKGALEFEGLANQWLTKINTYTRRVSPWLTLFRALGPTG